MTRFVPSAYFDVSEYDLAPTKMGRRNRDYIALHGWLTEHCGDGFYFQGLFGETMLVMRDWNLALVVALKFDLTPLRDPPKFR